MATTKAKESLKRFGWLLLIWAASVAVMGIAAYAMRLLMRAVGLSL